MLQDVFTLVYAGKSMIYLLFNVKNQNFQTWNQELAWSRLSELHTCLIRESLPKSLHWFGRDIECHGENKEEGKTQRFKMDRSVVKLLFQQNEPLQCIWVKTPAPKKAPSKIWVEKTNTIKPELTWLLGRNELSYTTGFATIKALKARLEK